MSEPPPVPTDVRDAVLFHMAIRQLVQDVPVEIERQAAYEGGDRCAVVVRVFAHLIRHAMIVLALLPDELVEPLLAQTREMFTPVELQRIRRSHATKATSSASR